jgi:hypothetical protein
MATTVVRAETLQRWRLALSWALAANVSYMELIGGDGAWAISSARDGERGYITTTGTRTCEAGKADDPVCLHRALVRVLTGMMPVYMEPAAAVRCPVCWGKGERWAGSGDDERNPQRFITCPECSGTGVDLDRVVRAA